MNKWQNMYNEKLTTAAEIASTIQSNTICATPIAAGEAFAIPEAIAERALKEDNLTGIKHCSLLSLKQNKLWDPTLSGKFSHLTLYISSNNPRKALWENHAEYVPSYYYQIPKIWDEYIEPDIFYATVSPMDQHGYFSLGLSVSTALTLKKKAKRVFLEVNENMPRTHGNSAIHISEVDAIVECTMALPELPIGEISEKERTIGGFISELVPNEATIQLGIGGIPNAAAQALINKKDLGIHTELFTESMIDLIEAGVVTNAKKNIHVGKTITTFALGTKRMYDFVNDNVGFEFLPVDYVNDPNTIGKHDNFISINSCIEVDLFGQVCAESLGPKQYSGVGGQVDFVRGACNSKGGKSIISMQSTAKNDTISKIKMSLTEGSIVTTSRNEVDYIVTEYGVAKLKGKSIGERAKALINIAHPNFREELTFDAKKNNLF